LALPDKPLSGPPVQHRYFRGQRPAQLQPQEIRQQVVVAEPVTLLRASASSDSTRSTIAGALKSGVAAGGSARPVVTEA